MASSEPTSRVDVTLGTTEVVMSLLQEAGDPVSRNWLLERLRESGHTTTRARLNRVLKFCFDLGLAVEGTKGVQWSHTTSSSLLKALSRGERRQAWHMPFRPESVVVHPDLEETYTDWETLAQHGKQPAQAVWNSLRTAISHLRLDGQWGEVIP